MIKRTGLALALIAFSCGIASAIYVPGTVPDFAGPTHIGVFLVEYQDIDAVDFPGRPFTPADETRISNALFGPAPSMRDLFAEMSFDTDLITGEILGTYSIAYDGYQPGVGCQAGPASSWAADVLAQADPDGTIYTYGGTGGFDMLMFVYSHGNNCDGAFGSVNGVAHRVAANNPDPQVGDALPFTTILNWRVEQTMAHEVGHLKGWAHAQLESYTGYQQGYGDHSCIMGDNYIYTNHPEYPVAVPDPADPPIPVRLEMRHASAPLKIKSGYIDPSDVLTISSIGGPQTVYLAPTELDPALGFPSPPNQAPIYHAAAIEFQELGRTYVVSYRHRTMSLYNLEFPYLMGRVHVHSFGHFGSDIVREASLEAGESFNDGDVTVTAISDGLNGEDYVEIEIDVAPLFTPGLSLPTLIEESNENGFDSAPIPLTVTSRGPDGTPVATYEISLATHAAEIAGASFSPASVTLASGESATVDVVLQFNETSLPEGSYDFEVIASDPAGGRPDGSVTGSYGNDFTGPVLNLSAIYRSIEVELSWNAGRWDDNYEIERDGAQLIPPGYATNRFTDSFGISPGSSHSYRVRGTDHLGNTGEWASATATDLCVQPPTVTVSPTEVKLTQTPAPGPLGSYTVSISNTNPAYCDTFSYSVEAQGNTPTNYQVLANPVQVAPGATEARVVSVYYFNPANPFEPVPQARFTFSVTVTDPHGFHATVPNLSFAYDKQDPGLPQNPLACLSGGAVTLSWTAASDNLGIAGYEVHGPAGFLGSTTDLFYTDGSADLQDLNYQVYAVDHVDRQSGAQTFAAAPPSLSINLLEPSPTSSASPAFSVTVTNHNPAACPDTTFNLSPVPGSGFTTTVQPSITLAGGASGDAAGVLNSTRDGVHNFQIDVDSLLVSGSYLVDTVGPSAPGKLIGAQGGGPILLAWGKSKDATTSVVGYRIDRDGAYLATVTGRSYVDATAPPHRPLTYTVRGIDAAGNLGAPSSVTAY